ncbi:MAG: type II toxin-antitoxin system Phd/YefM family antitoxin [Acidobacteria bacterium]|nr:type II toxin-antitoxin system Phd/YefM family antitoxin [Acidobacteriota bacterium]
MSTVSIAKARNTLTRLIHKAEDGEPVHITRHGKPVAVLVSRGEYERLSSGEPKKDFWQAVEDWRAQAGFDWPELTPDEVDGWRDRRPPREFSWPD